jgi:hypothetical protein
MLGELDPFDFVLAETLHMTVEEMNQRLSNAEYLQWRAFFSFREAMRDMKPVGGDRFDNEGAS